MDNLGRLPSVFARNCTVRRIDKGTAAAFLTEHHRMGDASARYRIGLFVSRHSGSGEGSLPEGTLVAAATFSSARRMRDGSRSFEWVRYASLSGWRVVGGMGKILEFFCRTVRPDDVMTYVPLYGDDDNGTAGASYLSLGFVSEGTVHPASGGSSLKLRYRTEADSGTVSAQ